jgi:metal-sulfur cluster biosynthetic enzyme
MESRYGQAYAALSAVVDPELDEPITDLGFVRSLVVTPAGNVKCNLRLPTSFCAPNFAYLMASDAKDVLSKLDWTRHVVVELDDHHDSEIINAGLAADTGYRGTFGHEAGKPRPPAGDVSAEGPYGGDGAVPHGAATGRPATLRIVVGRGPSG